MYLSLLGYPSWLGRNLLDGKFISKELHFSVPMLSSICNVRRTSLLLVVVDASSYLVPVLVLVRVLLVH